MDDKPSDALQNDIDKQQYNLTNFADVFEKISKLEKLNYSSKEQNQGAIKALRLLNNYILNRPIPK